MFSYIISFFCVLFPLYFWGYVLTLFQENDKTVHFKFWAGVFSWCISVGMTLIFAKFFKNFHIFSFIAIFLALLSIFYIFIFLATRFGSSVSRTFVRKTSILHMSVVACIFLLILFLWKFFQTDAIFSGILLAVFLPAFFEEISKHLSMMWLLGQKFSFSLRELTLFVFCVVLGFVFVENVLYFSVYGASIGLSLSRSIFAFSAHLLSALVAMFAWWKALEYPLISWKYFSFFFSGFLWASILHFFYNYSIGNNSQILLIPYCFAAYGLFVYFLKK